MPQNQPLTLEEFADRKGNLPPRYNNFIVYFMKGPIGDSMRENPFFREFQEHSPGLEARLREAMERAMPNPLKNLRPYDKDLYIAYLLMLIYGASNKDLIGDG